MRTNSRYHRHRFPAEIISHSVWLYFRFALSFRDVEEILAQRGVVLTYAIRTWCLKFGQTYANEQIRALSSRESYDGDLRGLAISGTSSKCPQDYQKHSLLMACV